MANFDVQVPMELKEKYGLLFSKDLELFCNEYKETLDKNVEDVDWEQVKAGLNHLTNLASNLSQYGVSANDDFFSYCDPGFGFGISKEGQKNKSI